MQHLHDAGQVTVVLVEAVELAHQVHADRVPLGVGDVVGTIALARHHAVLANQFCSVDW